MSQVSEITAVVTPVVEQAGYRLWDLTLTKAGKRTVVGVTLDASGGATLDGIAEVSKLIAPVLDEQSSLENTYYLEVSSPGLERPLTRPEHFQWSVGAEVAISHRVDGVLTRSRGKLSSATETEITLEMHEGSMDISLEDITKAHTLFDFEAAMKNAPDSQDEDSPTMTTQETA